MDEVTASLAVTIGGRVREGRRSRGWSLDRLAEVAGVSRRMVVNVEQGVVNPSVGTLLRLSDALGMGLPALVELRERLWSTRVNPLSTSEDTLSASITLRRTYIRLIIF